MPPSNVASPPMFWMFAAFCCPMLKVAIPLPPSEDASEQRDDDPDAEHEHRRLPQVSDRPGVIRGARRPEVVGEQRVRGPDAREGEQAESRQPERQAEDGDHARDAGPAFSRVNRLIAPDVRDCRSRLSVDIEGDLIHVTASLLRLCLYDGCGEGD